MTHNTKQGVVVELLSNNIYAVEFEEGKILKCYLAGKMKINHIRVLVGDKVAVVIDPYRGNATNRIVERLK